MGRLAVAPLYGAAVIAVMVGADFMFSRDRFWERLIANIGLVLVLVGFYRLMGLSDRSTIRHCYCLI